MERALTLHETAGLLNIHPRTVLREVQRGRLKHFRAGRSLRIPFASLVEYTQPTQHNADDRFIARRPCARRPIAPADQPHAELQNAAEAR